MVNTYGVIMAGGVGSRFWPVSTREFPKQFHDILGTGETLLQQTFRRVLKITHADKIIVITHRSYQKLVAEQLTELPEENIITEPIRRNTALCIAYAAYRIRGKDPNATMIVVPSDHLITNEDEFVRITKVVLEQAATLPHLYTIGIKPKGPDTGYGYIQYIDQKKVSSSKIRKVKTFTEKPTQKLAQQFLNSGDVLWNSGIFIWNVPGFIKEIEEHIPDLFATLESGKKVFGTRKEEAFVNEVYPDCQNVSIDYALLEKSHHVYVILSDFGFSDLGTWGSLYHQIKHDENQNAAFSSNVMFYGSKNNIVRLPKTKLAVIEGLEGYIIVDQGDFLLICKKQHEQLIKSFVRDIKLKYGSYYTGL